MTRPQARTIKGRYVKIAKIDNADGHTAFIEGYTWSDSEQALFAFRAGKDCFGPSGAGAQC